MRVKSLAAGWLALLLAFSLVGCGKQGALPERGVGEGPTRSTPAEKTPNRQQVNETRSPNYQVRAPQINVAGGQGQQTAEQQAKVIAETVTRIQGVERASVLVAGKTALVGIDLKSNITGSMIDSIKFSVKEAVERSGNGYRAVVSADLDTVTRARSLIRDVQSGKPVEGISNEIADIVSRLIPEM